MRVVILLILILSCSNREALISNDLIIINYKDYGREEFASLIREITKCNPKFIYIDAFFEELVDQKNDSLLALAIRESNRVILPYTYVNDSVKVSSNQLFINSCHFQSRRPNIYTAPYVCELYNIHGTSFPIDILLKLDSELGINIIQDKKLISVGIELNLKAPKFGFNKIDADSVTVNFCNELKDKIVLVGYLGPEKVDGVEVDDNKFVYSVEILALAIAELIAKK